MASAKIWAAAWRFEATTPTHYHILQNLLCIVYVRFFRNPFACITCNTLSPTLSVHQTPCCNTNSSGTQYTAVFLTLPTQKYAIVICVSADLSLSHTSRSGGGGGGRDRCSVSAWVLLWGEAQAQRSRGLPSKHVWGEEGGQATLVSSHLLMC